MDETAFMNASRCRVGYSPLRESMQSTNLLSVRALLFSYQWHNKIIGKQQPVEKMLLLLWVKLLKSCFLRKHKDTHLFGHIHFCLALGRDDTLVSYPSPLANAMLWVGSVLPKTDAVCKSLNMFKPSYNWRLCAWFYQAKAACKHFGLCLQPL